MLFSEESVHINKIRHSDESFSKAAPRMKVLLLISRISRPSLGLGGSSHCNSSRPNRKCEDLRSPCHMRGRSYEQTALLLNKEIISNRSWRFKMPLRGKINRAEII